MDDTDKTHLTQSPGIASKAKLSFSRVQIIVIVSVLFTLIVQRAGFAILGSGPTRSLFLDALTLFVDCLSIGCCVAASTRHRGVARTFWLLFATLSILELIGNAGWGYYRYFNIEVPGSALFPSLLYRLEAVPVALALFLSEDLGTSRLESFLNTCMVVGLVGVTTYQVQMAELDAHNTRIWQVITIGSSVNLVLLIAAVVRRRFASTATSRGLFGRVVIYVAIFMAISVITSLVEAYIPSLEASVDLLWIVPSLLIAATAALWRPPVSAEQSQSHQLSRRTALLCFNLTLATMVLGSAVLGLRLVGSTRIIGLAAVTVVLFSFAIRSAILQDIQESYLAALQASRADLEHQALYDELTGLPNRRLFTERLSQVLAIAEREDQTVALFYLDLDGFKPVNDRLGHGVGDLLLKGVANRMLTRTRKSDTFARMSGDEFTWLVAHLPSGDEAARLAEGMLRDLSEPFEIEGHVLSITASIGIALYPQNASSAASLLQQADSAMYAVKHNGKNGVQYFAPQTAPR